MHGTTSRREQNHKTILNLSCNWRGTEPKTVTNTNITKKWHLWLHRALDERESPAIPQEGVMYKQLDEQKERRQAWRHSSTWAIHQNWGCGELGWRGGGAGRKGWGRGGAGRKGILSKTVVRDTEIHAEMDVCFWAAEGKTPRSQESNQDLPIG